LFEIFNQVGPVASIRVCRDSITRRSLGYAYVNFVNVVDAERALDTLNNHPIRGKQCRIMWSQRDPTIRKSGVGNIFIKNLDPSIDHKQLFDTFSQYGNILSCKVATDENGQSKSYGFVHFETQEAADLSIAKVNGTHIGAMKVYVGKFIPKKEWLKQKENSWTNIFCKNLPPTFTDEKLVTLFSEFGGITSAVVSKTAAGQETKADEPAKAPAKEGEAKPAEGETAKAEGDATATEEAAAPKEPKEKTLFGFVNFKNHTDAVRAVQALHGKTLDGKYDLYCSRAQKKSERANELKKKFEQLKLERMTKYQGINLYIKNLEDEVDEERLRKEFSPFGKVKTVKIEPGRGFGFLCFTTPEEANRALTEMNGRILPGCQKPLYVNLFEPREVRKQKLAAQYAARMKARPAPNAGNVPPPAGMGYPGPGGYMPYPPGPQGYFPGPFRGPGPRWAGPPQGAAGQQFAGQPGQIAGRAHQQPGGPAPQGGQPRPNGQQGAQPQGGQARQPQANGAPQGQNAGQRRIQSRGGAAPQGAPQGAPAAPAEPQLLSVQQIQAFPAAQQRMLIGERLYYKIQQKDPIRAGKITGMFLDLAQNNLDELYRLLESDEALFQKVEEAVRVLEEAAKKQQQQTPAPAAEDK